MPLLAELVRKDLLRKIRSPLALVVALAFPLIFAGLIALVFGRGGGESPKVRLILENRDDGFVARTVASAFTSQEAAQHFDVRTVKSGEGRLAIEAGEASALIVIPAGFSEAVLDAQPTTLTLVRNPAEGIMPEVAEQIVSIMATGIDGASRVLRGPLEKLRPFLRDGSGAPADVDVAALAVQFNQTIRSAGSFVLPPAITLEGAFEANPGEGDSSPGAGALFLIVLPGIAVYSLFLVGDNGMRDLLTEIVSGTLRRQLAAPVRPAMLVAGKALFAAVQSLLALGVIGIVAAVFAPKLPDPAGFVLLSLALVLAIVGTSAAIYGVARTERRGATFASLIYLVMGFAGGSFLPIESLPPAVRAVSPWTPFYWGTRGYRALMESGAGVKDVLPNVAVLAGLGVALLLVGSVFLGRAVRRGGAAA